MDKLNTGGDDACPLYACSLTDEMWQVIAPLLPTRDPARGGRPQLYSHRLVIDTILYVLVSGFCAWRLTPRTYPSGATEAAIGDTVAQQPINRLDHEVWSAIRTFVFQLANGTLEREILAGPDYRLHLANSGSGLEMAFAIFTNVLTINDGGHVTNHSEAQSRAAQWLRAYCSPGYQIEPPLKDWVTELI